MTGGGSMRWARAIACTGKNGRKGERMAVAAMTVGPLVGVTSSRGRGRYMWWFHCISLRMMGARPVRLTAPVSPGDAERFDGFVIGGGDDISAELYRGVMVPDIRIDPERDRMELELLEHVVTRDMPVLGVCRGAQMINVYRGGSLYQDMYEAFADLPRLRTPLPRKQVRLEPRSRLAGITGTDRLTVNSLHHQAIDRLGSGLEVSARDTHGVTQAVEDPNVPFRIGVQWHPEFLFYQRRQRRVFRAFVDAAATYANKPHR